MVGAERGAGGLELALRGQQGALGIEHGAEIDQAAGIALARQQFGIGGRLGRGLQSQQALAVAGQRGQPVLDLLQRGEQRSLVADARLLEGGLLGAQLGARRTPSTRIGRPLSSLILRTLAIPELLKANATLGSERYC